MQPKEIRSVDQQTYLEGSIPSIDSESKKIQLSRRTRKAIRKALQEGLKVVPMLQERVIEARESRNTKLGNPVDPGTLPPDGTIFQVEIGKQNYINLPIVPK